MIPQYANKISVADDRDESLVPLSHTSSTLNELNSEIQCSRDLVAQIRDRLIPVLRSDVQDKGSAPKPTVALVPLADAIRCQTEQLRDDVNTQLRRILDTIEL